MIKTQRQNEILKLLGKDDIILISGLAEVLNCSMMTIRRDVEEMEAKSLVRKMHGGVELYKNKDVQPSFIRRVIENPHEKSLIAEEAVKHIKPGSTVFFDAGTTPLYVTKALKKGIVLTAITNCVMTATEVCNKPNVTVIMIGGELHHSSYSTVNNIANSAASKFRTDLAIISTRSISVPEGLYEATLPLIEIKKTIVKCAESVLLLADHSKFNETAMCLSIKLGEIDAIITDSEAPIDKIEELRKFGIQVTQVVT
jgi:DeoR family transcriptional regulator, fructose operon transcriptional repressor